MSKFYDYCCTCQHLYEEYHRGACSDCNEKASNYVNVETKKESNEMSTTPFNDYMNDINKTKREEILMAAKNIVCSDRNKQYGEPEDNFGNIAKLWSVYTGLTLTAKDVALMMTLFKIGRLMSNPEKDDSWVDAAGYIACGAECATKGE